MWAFGCIHSLMAVANNTFKIFRNKYNSDIKLILCQDCARNRKRIKTYAFNVIFENICWMWAKILDEEFVFTSMCSNIDFTIRPVICEKYMGDEVTLEEAVISTLKMFGIEPTRRRVDGLVKSVMCPEAKDAAGAINLLTDQMRDFLTRISSRPEDFYKNYEIERAKRLSKRINRVYLDRDRFGVFFDIGSRSFGLTQDLDDRIYIHCDVCKSNCYHLLALAYYLGLAK